MNCPECGADTRVLSTRGTERRRECFNMHRFSTSEVVVNESGKPLKFPKIYAPRHKLSDDEQKEVANYPASLSKTAAKFKISISTAHSYRKRWKAIEATLQSDRGASTGTVDIAWPSVLTI